MIRNIHIFKIWLIALFGLCSCAGLHTRESSLDIYKKRVEVVSIAKEMVGKNEILVGDRKYSYDCSGFDSAVYDKALGIKLFKINRSSKGKNGVELIFTYFQENGKLYKSGIPSEGDIVFFDKTYDLNKDGRLNDRLTHAGIVEKVDNSKTITFIHLTSKGIERSYMNLKHPHTDVNPRNKSIYNSFIRKNIRKIKGKELTAELFRAFGSI